MCWNLNNVDNLKTASRIIVRSTRIRNIKSDQTPKVYSHHKAIHIFCTMVNSHRLGLKMAKFIHNYKSKMFVCVCADRKALLSNNRKSIIDRTMVLSGMGLNIH